MQVTFEAVKEQLEILGHSVPDDVVRDFLADINKSSGGAAGPSAAQPHEPSQFQDANESASGSAHANNLDRSAATRDQVASGTSLPQAATSWAGPEQPHGPVMHDNARWLGVSPQERVSEHATQDEHDLQTQVRQRYEGQSAEPLERPALVRAPSRPQTSLACC